MNRNLSVYLRWICAATVIALVVARQATFSSVAQEPQKQEPQNTEASKADDTAPPIAEFEKYLTNATLTGVFTIDGQPLGKLEEERYEIKSAKKVPGEDKLWEINTRIKYGDKDLVVPVFVNIDWVGRTPMIVLDSMAIPGLGTFSARVVFHDRKYAGTWKHDNVGGHLFGRVEPAKDDQ